MADKTRQRLFAQRDTRPWAEGGNKVHIAGEDGKLLCKKNYAGVQSERITRLWLKVHTGEPDTCSICCKKAQQLIN